jgi:hypothetical protein
MGQSDGNAERNARMYELWKDGLALASIADEFKLTVETIRLKVGQMDRIAMWRLIGRDAKGKRLASFSFSAPPAG